MTKLVNLTNRTITVYDPEGKVPLFDLPTDPPAIDAEFVPQNLGRVIDDESGCAVDIVRHSFELVNPEDLPDPTPGTVFIVGYPVLQAVAARGINRDDLVAPDTARGSSAVYGTDGRIVGVRRFRAL